MKIYNLFYMGIVAFIIGCGETSTLVQPEDQSTVAKEENRQNEDAAPQTPAQKNPSNDQPSEETPSDNQPVLPDAGKEEEPVDTNPPASVSSLELEGLEVVSFYDNIRGFEPAKLESDGTVKMIKDINTDPAGIHIYKDSYFVTLHGITYFFIDDGVHGISLYRTDGTEEGTWRVKDISKGDNYLLSPVPHMMSVFKDKLYFSIDHALWVSDGTSTGTKKIKENFIVREAFVVLGDFFYFNGIDLTQSDRELRDQLYRSDGTAEGTVKLTDFIGYGANNITLWKDKIYFGFDISRPTPQRILLSYDPSTGAVVKYPDASLPYNAKLFVFQDKLLKFYNNLLSYLNEDADEFTLMASFGGDAYRDEWVAQNDTFVYIETQKDSVHYLHRVNGSTHDIEAFEIDYIPSVYLDHSIYYLQRTSKYSTRAKLMKIAEDSNVSEEIFEFTLTDFYKVKLKVIDDKLYFTGHNDKSDENYQLYESNGTTEGTRLIVENMGEVIEEIYNCNGSPCFVASDATYGKELRIVDETFHLVKDINTKTMDSVFQKEHYDSNRGYTYVSTTEAEHTPSKEYLKIGNLVYFVVNMQDEKKIYRSDGTEEGTFEVSDGAFAQNPITGDIHMAQKDGLLYFTAEGGEDDYIYLCKSDGTKSNSIIVKQLAKAPRDFINDLVTFNNTLYFNAPLEDDPSTFALFKSDGTAEGTEVVMIIPDGRYIVYFQVLDEKLYFFSDTKLWESDGTVENTKLIFENSTGFPRYDGEIELMKMADGLYVLEYSSFSGYLWKLRLDGSAEADPFYSSSIQFVSTEPVDTDIETSYGYSEIVNHHFFNGTLYLALNYFNENNKLAPMLVSFDVNNHTFTLVKKDFCTYDSIKNFADAGDKLFFTAEDSTNGNELWISDGTDAGTHIVKDIMPGTGSSNPYIYKTLDQKLLFMASDTFTGRLWLTDGTAEGTKIIRRE